MTTQEHAALRALPSVDRLLAAAQHLIDEFGRPATTAALRSSVDAARDRVRGGAAAPSHTDLITAAERRLHRAHPPPPRPVINATGVVVHTNLGRAPLASAARDAMLAASGYCDLEYDLASGGRGSRTARLEPLLCAATGAQAAFAVNNAAAALVLALAALAADRDVLVLGIGNSAVDLAVETSRHSRKTYLAMRRGAHVIPKYVRGKPVDQLDSELTSRLPARLTRWALARLSAS